MDAHTNTPICLAPRVDCHPILLCHYCPRSKQLPKSGMYCMLNQFRLSTSTKFQVKRSALHSQTDVSTFLTEFYKSCIPFGDMAQKWLLYHSVLLKKWGKRKAAFSPEKNPLNKEQNVTEFNPQRSLPFL